MAAPENSGAPLTQEPAKLTRIRRNLAKTLLIVLCSALLAIVLVHALSHLHVRPQAGGVHVLAYLSDRHDDKRVAAAAAADGLGVQSLSDWRMRASAQGGLLMGFANFATAEDARAAVQRLSAHLVEGKG